MRRSLRGAERGSLRGTTQSSSCVGFGTFSECSLLRQWGVTGHNEVFSYCLAKTDSLFCSEGHCEERSEGHCEERSGGHCEERSNLPRVRAATKQSSSCA